MNGFGKDFEKTTLNEELYHSATFEGLENLLYNNRQDYPVCTSTGVSARFMDRDLVVVFSEKERTGDYTSFDADAGKDYGYDEFRVCVDIEDIEEVQLNDSLFSIWESDESDDEEIEAIYDSMISMVEDFGINFVKGEN